MFITNADYQAIEKALMLLPHDDDFSVLSQEDQETIITADKVMLQLYQKKKSDNRRTAAYIAEKRKVNKFYARSK